MSLPRMLASRNQWNYMMGTDGAGDYTALRTGSNLQSDGYWTSSEGMTGTAWKFDFGTGKWGNGSKTTGSFRVRACLAF